MPGYHEACFADEKKKKKKKEKESGMKQKKKRSTILPFLLSQVLKVLVKLINSTFKLT